MSATILHITPITRAVCQAVRERARANAVPIERQRKAIATALAELHNKRSPATAIAIANRTLRIPTNTHATAEPA